MDRIVHGVAKSWTRLSDFHFRDFLVAQRVKHLPSMWETWVRSLARDDPLEKEMAPHSSTLAWKIPWTEEPGGLQSMGLQKSWTRLSNFISLECRSNHLPCGLRKVT